MRVCVWERERVCVCACVRVYVCVCVCVCMYYVISAHMCVCVFVCMNYVISAHLRTRDHMTSTKCLHTQMRVESYICIYFIVTYTHVCKYIYIYLYTCV